MINLNIKIDENQILKQIIINGHSNFDKKGKDIVCAGISILYYSFLLTIKKMPDLNIDLNENLNEIKLIIKKYNNFLIGELRGITLIFINGLKLLEKDYKKNLKINITD